MKPICLEVGFDDPLGGISLTGALVGGGEAEAVAMCELEEDGIGDGLVDGVQHLSIQLRCLEGNLKHLNCGDAVTSSEIDGFR